MKELPALSGTSPLTQNEAKNIARKWYDIDANLEVMSELYPNVTIDWNDILSYLENKPEPASTIHGGLWESYEEGQDQIPYTQETMSLFDFSNKNKLDEYNDMIAQHIQNAAENNNMSAMLFFMADPHFDRNEAWFGKRLFDIAVAAARTLYEVQASPEIISTLLDQPEVKAVVNQGDKNIHTLLEELYQEFRHKRKRTKLPGYVDLYRRILLFPVWNKEEAKEMTFVRVVLKPYINPILKKILILPINDTRSMEAQRELVRLINATLEWEKSWDKDYILQLRKNNDLRVDPGELSKWINSLRQKYGTDHPVLSQIQE
jgi:hypothetical protein